VKEKGVVSWVDLFGCGGRGGGGGGGGGGDGCTLIPDSDTGDLPSASSRRIMSSQYS
jgi:hypothetical protein